MLCGVRPRVSGSLQRRTPGSGCGRPICAGLLPPVVAVRPPANSLAPGRLICAKWNHLHGRERGGTVTGKSAAAAPHRGSAEPEGLMGKRKARRPPTTKPVVWLGSGVA